MALPHAEKLIDQARSGVRLNIKDRQHCLVYLSFSDPTMTNEELGGLFQVSERQIRADKKHIREEKAKLITQDDISLVIADIAMSLEKQKHDIEKSKSKCQLGTTTYLKHCQAMFDIQIRSVQILQDLGYYPKNLGTLTEERYEYKSIITKDKSVETRPVSFEEVTGQKVIEAEFEEVGEQKALPAGKSDLDFDTFLKQMEQESLQVEQEEL